MWKWVVVTVWILLLASAGYCTDYDGVLHNAKDRAIAGDYTTAISLCNGVIAAHLGPPVEPKALLLLGNILSKKQAPTSDTISQFAQLVDRFPISAEAPEALLRIGNLHNRLKQPAPEWDRIVADYPSSDAAAEALLHIGYRSDRLKGDPRPAFERLCREHPAAKEAVEAWRCLGQLALRVGDPDTAIADFQHSAGMTSVDADSAETSRVEMGYAHISRYWKTRDASSLTRAISALSPVLKSKTQERAVRARLGRGEAFILLGIPERALAEYQAALALQPENLYLKGIAGFEIGVCYDGMDAWSNAEAAFASFLSGVAGADLVTKDSTWKQGRPDYMKVVSQDPDRANALSGVDLVGRAAFRRAVLLYKLKRYDEAQSQARDVTSAFPGLAEKVRTEIPASGGSR